MRRGRPRHPDVLTPRQWEVLRLVRAGLSNEEIARRLGISVDGAKFHVSEILGKLGVSTRAEAARWDVEREREAARPTARLRLRTHFGEGEAGLPARSSRSPRCSRRRLLRRRGGRSALLGSERLRFG